MYREVDVLSFFFRLTGQSGRVNIERTVGISFIDMFSLCNEFRQGTEQEPSVDKFISRFEVLSNLKGWDEERRGMNYWRLVQVKRMAS